MTLGGELTLDKPCWSHVVPGAFQAEKGGTRVRRPEGWAQAAAKNWKGQVTNLWETLV